MLLFMNSPGPYDRASPGPCVDAIAATASQRDLTSSARVVPRPAAVISREPSAARVYCKLSSILVVSG